MSERYFERIGFTGDSDQLFAQISEEFKLGPVQSASVLAVGFEDCNVHIQTGTGDFVVKAFAKVRDDGQVERYVDIMKSAIDGGVHHPPLHQESNGNVLFRHQSGISMVVMDFIDGQTYFDTKTVPTIEELELVMAEAVKIHALADRPTLVHDSWAIPYIHSMREKVEPFLDEDSKALASKAVTKYDDIDLSKLTTCFVHGDIITTNTLRGRDGKVWILDFSVANVYPKVQEIAVIASSLMASDKHFVPLHIRVEQAVAAYLKAGGALTDYEQQILFNYAIAGAAMEFMGGHKAKYIDKEDPKECDHWIELGKEALVEALDS